MKKTVKTNKKVTIAIIAVLSSAAVLGTTAFAADSAAPVFGEMFAGKSADGMYSGGNVQIISENVNVDFKGVMGDKNTAYAVMNITSIDGSAFAEDIDNSFVTHVFSEEGKAAEVTCTRSAFDKLSSKLFYHPNSGDGDVEYVLEDANTIRAAVSYNDNEFNIIGQTLTVSDDKLNVYHVDQVIYTTDEWTRIFNDHQNDDDFWSDGLDILGKAEKEYGKALSGGQHAVYAPGGDIVIATVKEIPVDYTVSVQLNYKDNSRTISEAAGKKTTYYNAEMTVKELEVNPYSVKLDLLYPTEDMDKVIGIEETLDQTIENTITLKMQDGTVYTSSNAPVYTSDNMERLSFTFTDDQYKTVVIDPQNILTITYNGTLLYEMV